MTSGRPDATLVRRHLLALDDALQVLRRHQGRSRAELEDHREEQWAVEHGLQLCAQNALDIATHLSASAGREVSDYAAAVDSLGQLQVLPREFAARFRSVAGFRNVIVHGYLSVDLGLVHRLLNERLEDFAEFARYIETHLSKLD